MKKVLIFDNILDGHHLEYIHHLYEVALRMPFVDFYFAVPEEFEQAKTKFDWVRQENIHVVKIEKNDINLCSKTGYFTKSLYYARVLKRYVDQYAVNEVFLITMVYPFPFLPFFMGGDVKVSGIIYRIYLYEWKSLSVIKKCKDVLETFIMAKAKCVKSIFVLNDNSAACYFNKLFNADKFKSIVDPTLPLSCSSRNIRNELGIDESDCVYLHFGAMTERKGTLEILDALKMLSEEELKGKVFVFAGKIGNAMKGPFYDRIQRLGKKVKILVYDRFCSYEFLNDLCKSCDVVLTPYKNTSYSSGVLGYVALFNKMVVGPKEGLLGKLIRRNNLGFAKESMTAENLAKVIAMGLCGRFDGEKYVLKNNVGSFKDSIINMLLD